jgi:MoxR-like ATPase
MQNLLRATLSYAAIKGRDYAIPDDVKAVFAPVVTHRLSLEPMAQTKPAALIEAILDSVAAPTEVKGSDLA